MKTSPPSPLSACGEGELKGGEVNKEKITNMKMSQAEAETKALEYLRQGRH